MSDGEPTRWPPKLAKEGQTSYELRERNTVPVYISEERAKAEESTESTVAWKQNYNQAITERKS